MIWQPTGQSKQVDNWTETTVQLKLSEVPADTATVKYVQQGTKVRDNWSNTSTATKYTKTNYAKDAVVTSSVTGYVVNSTGWNGSATESGTIPAATDTIRWVGTGNTKSVGLINKTTYYEVQEQTNDPTYNYTKRVNQPTTQYEYQEWENHTKHIVISSFFSRKVSNNIKTRQYHN